MPPAKTRKRAAPGAVLAGPSNAGAQQVAGPAAQGPAQNPAKRSLLDFAALQRHNPVPSSSRVLCCIDKSWDAPAYTEYSKLDYAMIAIQSERALNHSEQIVDSGGVSRRKIQRY